MKDKHYISCGYLRNNVNRLSLKVKKGFFNIIIVFGATRTGKTTIAAQICKYMSLDVGVSFNVNDIFFDTADLVKEAQKGIKNKIYQLDEAAFDLMGEDWHKKAQKDLIKLTMTAAKYNQTFVILIPRLERLRETLISDEHTVGIGTYYNKRTFVRGYYSLYDKRTLLSLYDTLKNKKYYKMKMIRPPIRGRFTKRMADFINMKKYNEMKDAAIKKIGESENKDKKDGKKEWILNAVRLGLKRSDIAKSFGVTSNYIGNIVRDSKVITTTT